MIPAFQKDEALLADIARPTDGDKLRIWWLGQSGFLLRHGGSLLLLDPYLSDSLTLKYAATDKPHTRMTEQVLTPGDLRDIAVVTSSHNHTDHLDAGTLLPIFKANPAAQFIIPEANRTFVAERLGCEPGWPVGLDDGRTVVVNGWQLTGIAAAHNEFQTDEAGRHHFMGFIVRRGPWTIYSDIPASQRRSPNAQSMSHFSRSTATAPSAASRETSMDAKPHNSPPTSERDGPCRIISRCLSSTLRTRRTRSSPGARNSASRTA